MSLFHPLLAIVEKRDSLERVLPGVQLCLDPPRCQADAETGAGGQEGGGLASPLPRSLAGSASNCTDREICGCWSC